MKKQLTTFRIIYLLFLVFALIHFILVLFGLAFTPGLWNLWLLFLGFTILTQLWIRFYQRRKIHKRCYFLEFFSGFVVFCVWGLTLLFFSFVEDSHMPITIDYLIEPKEIVIIRGSLLHEIHEYHDLVNPLIMKSKVKYVEKN